MIWFAAIRDSAAVQQSSSVIEQCSLEKLKLEHAMEDLDLTIAFIA